MLKRLKPLVKELTGFGIVGILSTLSSYLLYVPLIQFFSATTAYSLSYFVGLVINFFLNSRYVFKSALKLSNVISFIGSHALNFILSILILKIALAFGANDLISPVLVLLIVAPINFFLVRRSMNTKRF